jgi:hypothetical protein
MRGCNPRRPLGPVLGAHAQGLLLGQPSVFRAFILQHHDEVELSARARVIGLEGGAGDGAGEGAAGVDVLVVSSSPIPLSNRD